MSGIIRGALLAALLAAASGQVVSAAAPLPAATLPAAPGEPAYGRGAAKTYWDRILSHCGPDRYRTYARSEIIDYQAPVTFSLEDQPLTPAEHAAGYQWKVRSTLHAAAWRSRGDDEELQTRGDWTEYQPGGDQSVTIALAAGKLSFDGAELVEIPKGLSCDLINGPSMGQPPPKPPKQKTR